MFTVRCPSTLLWHPSVHHSLLLLRALQLKHTLVLTNESNIDEYSSNRSNNSYDKNKTVETMSSQALQVAKLPYTLLSQIDMQLSITWNEHHNNINTHSNDHRLEALPNANVSLHHNRQNKDKNIKDLNFCRTVYSPEHIIHLLFANDMSNNKFSCKSDFDKNREEEVQLRTCELERVNRERPYVQELANNIFPDSSNTMYNKLRLALPNYLETCVVCNHIYSAIDALLVALSTNDMEQIRRMHAWLMDNVAQLDFALNKDNYDNDDNNEQKEDELETQQDAMNGSAHTFDATHTKYLQSKENNKALGNISHNIINENNSHGGGDDVGCHNCLTLSTWPLFALLSFLIEECGLLLSPFPCLSITYDALLHHSCKHSYNRKNNVKECQYLENEKKQVSEEQYTHNTIEQRQSKHISGKSNKLCEKCIESEMIQRHYRFIQRTVSAYANTNRFLTANNTTTNVDAIKAAHIDSNNDCSKDDQISATRNVKDNHKELSIAYPQRHFLFDVQRRIANYTTGVYEQSVQNVTTDGGAVNVRMQSGRLGMQSVPAHLPWPFQKHESALSLQTQKVNSK